MMMVGVRWLPWRSVRLSKTYRVSTSTELLTKPPVTMDTRQVSNLQSDRKTPPTVTMETIFSAENRERVRGSLLDVEPIRSTKNLPPETSPERGRKNDSAVLIPLCLVDREPSVLFTLRSTSLRNHRGEVSFPGGRRDESDLDFVHTALRETEEELGLQGNKVDVWGPAQPIPNKDGTAVATPVLGFCGEIEVDQLNPNTDEVEVVFTRTIQSLIDPHNIGSTQFRGGRGFNKGRGYTLPVYIGGEYRIWGLTAIILHQTLTLLAPGLYTYRIRHQS